jgi:esterase FrsA
LPSLFYFSLSGPDSLCKDPFNQPIQFLSHRWIRCFSLTLPAHENGLDPTRALSVWAEDINKGLSIFDPFFEGALAALDFVIEQKLAAPQQIAIAGLSRGGFAASHLAARDTRFRAVCQFAPLTQLSRAKEFQEIADHPYVRSLALEPLIPALADRPFRVYIGNRDHRVDTRACFEFADKLCNASSRRSPPIEFITFPSIGWMGHGTPPGIFAQGAEWIAAQIQSTSS